MKLIKIILGIITALTLVFFATGLFVKETNYSAKVTINKPVNQVFEEFNKPENLKEWIPEIQSYQIVNESVAKIGNVYKIVILNQDQEITLTEKVLAYVPNEKVTLFYDAENMLKTDDYIFTSQNNSTTITLNSSCKSDSYIMACLFPYFKGTFKNQDQSYLNNFKDFIEKQ